MSAAGVARSDTYIDKDYDTWATLTPTQGASNLAKPGHAGASLKPQPAAAPTVLASETPGLPQFGIDYEDTFPANFFMNPFSVSFPGDIDIPWDFNQPAIHLPDDSQDQYGTIEGSYEHHRLDMQAGWSHTTRPHSAAPVAAIPRHLSPVSAGRSHPTGPRQPKRGSNSSSPLPNAANSSTPSMNINRPSTSPLINVTLPSPSPTSTPTINPFQHTSGAPTPAPTNTTSSSTPSSSTKAGDEKSGGFQFVDASDRKTIVRLRNTMVSRKHRDNKVQRIKELERMLEERDREIEELRKAVAEGGKGKRQ